MRKVRGNKNVKYRAQKTEYTAKDIDCFLIHFNSKLYLIPRIIVQGMSAIVLRLTDKYSNQNKPFYAKDYEI